MSSRSERRIGAIFRTFKSASSGGQGFGMRQNSDPGRRGAPLPPPGTYAAGAPVSTLRWRETPQGAGEPHDTPSHKRTRHNSSYVLRTSRLAAPGPHRVRHAGRFTGHSGPILPGGVFFAAHMSREPQESHIRFFYCSDCTGGRTREGAYVCLLQ